MSKHCTYSAWNVNATIHPSGGTLAQEYTLENRIVAVAGAKICQEDCGCDSE